MSTLSELLGNKQDDNTVAEQAIIDNSWYVKGKEGYPTAPPETLPQSLSERHTVMYMMGYNYAEWERYADNR